jgi:hypothetical protein
MARVCLLIFVASTRPRVMCFGCQLAPPQCKISCPPFDIHKLKLAIIEWHSTKLVKINNYLVFSIKRDNIHEKEIRKKRILDTNAY